MAVSVAEQRAGDAGASLPRKRVGGDFPSLEGRRDRRTRVLAEAVRQLDGVVVVRRVLRRLAAQRQREHVDAVRVVGRAACALVQPRAFFKSLDSARDAQRRCCIRFAF